MFLYTNNGRLENQNWKRKDLFLNNKTVHYAHLTKDVHNLHGGNYKTLLKDMKWIEKMQRDKTCLCLRRFQL